MQHIDLLLHNIRYTLYVKQKFFIETAYRQHKWRKMKILWLLSRKMNIYTVSLQYYQLTYPLQPHPSLKKGKKDKEDKFTQGPFCHRFPKYYLEKNLADSVCPYNLLLFGKYFSQISQIFEYQFFLIFGPNLIIGNLLEIEILPQSFIFYKNTLITYFLREH